jgi:hypothetical protein
MILLTNGCSFTEGYGLVDRQSNWPSQLGICLNQNPVNLALGGASNDRIFRTTIEYLNTNPTPGLVVIGWTVFNRAELESDTGMYLRLTNIDCLPDTAEVTKDFTNIHKFWLTNLYNQYMSYRNWVHYVLHLQDYFDSKQIKYRFFSAFGNNYIQEFITESDRALELADQSFQWRDRKKYNPCRDIHKEYQELIRLTKQIDLSNWITNNQHTMQSFLNIKKCAVDNTGHFLADGHQIWATQIQKEL